MRYAERRKIALQAEIIEAAFDVFAERGYHDAGVAEIADRVGIGLSTFYRHFPSKREMFDRVIDTVVDSALAALSLENAPEAAHTLGEYRAQVDRIAAALDGILGDWRISRILLVRAFGVDEELDRRMFAVVDLAVSLTVGYLDYGVGSGYLDERLDTTATARALVGMIAGLALVGTDPAVGTEARESAIRAAVAMMFDGVAAWPRTSGDNS